MSCDLKKSFVNGTKSLLRNNNSLNYPNEIKYNKIKISFPSGLDRFISLNQNDIKDYLYDNINNIDFIDSFYFKKNIKMNLKNKKYSEFFRQYAFVKWFEQISLV